MVLLKNLLLIGATLAVAIPSPLPRSNGQELTVQEREAPPLDSVITKDIDHKRIKARVPGRMTLQWSPQGRILFLCGAAFPQALIDGFYAAGPAGPAKVLVEDFQTFITNQGMSGLRLLSQFLYANKGGVYGKGAPDIAGTTFGFGLQTAAFPTATELQDLLDAISAWAGGTVQVIARPNNFFDLARIGAGGGKRDVLIEERSRTDQYPAVDNILQYATLDVPDVDINRDIRWGGLCPD